MTPNNNLNFIADELYFKFLENEPVVFTAEQQEIRQRSSDLFTELRLELPQHLFDKLMEYSTIQSDLDYLESIDAFKEGLKCGIKLGAEIFN